MHKSPSEIIKISNDLSTKLSSAADQVSNYSIIKNNTDQMSMK